MPDRPSPCLYQGRRRSGNTRSDGRGICSKFPLAIPARARRSAGESCLFAALAAQASPAAPPRSEGSSMIDFAKARRTMVDSQLRPTDVSDREVLEAFLAVPRERFVSADLASVAYLDRDLAV